MAKAPSRKAASRESPPRSCYEADLNVRARFKILGGSLSRSSEERSYETV
jgi:hypothetical protein